MEVFLFDDSELELRLRGQEAERALGRLAREGAITLDGDGVRGFSRRVELLEALGDLPEDRDVVLLSDLFSDVIEGAGNIGYRLTRAVAQHPTHGERVRRVMWSRFSFADVTDGTAPWVHAFAAYHPDSYEALAEAILHAIDPGTTVGDATAVFPKALPMEYWSDRVRILVEELVGEPQVGDDRIVAMLARRVPTLEINQMLGRIKVSHRSSVIAFLNAVQEYNRLATPDAARARVLGGMSRNLSVHQVSDGLPFAELDEAITYRTELLEQVQGDRPQGGPAETAAWLAEAHAAYLAITWLTPAEDALLGGFLELYAPLVEELHRNAGNARVLAIQKIIGTEFDEPLPAWVALKEDLGLDELDLSYATLTLADVRVGR